jgi:hypothetical protein
MSTDRVVGVLRIPWAALHAHWGTPPGAVVEIDVTGVDKVPERTRFDTDNRNRRDKYDFLDARDRAALEDIASNGSRIEVVGDNPDRIRSMVQVLRALVADEAA